MAINYHDYPVLYVDDEPHNLVAFRYAMEDRFTSYTASSGEEAVRILRERDVAVLMADQRMPIMTGVQVCAKAREIRPNAVRIIVTAYTDLHVAIEAINQGEVLRYLTKPWRNEEVVEVLRTSIELIHLQRTVQEMEVRLIQRGPTTAVTAVQQELAHEFNHPLSSLVVNAELVSDLITASLGALNDGNHDQAKLLLANAQEGHQDALAAIGQLRSMVARLRQNRKPSSEGAPARCEAARVVDSTVRIIRREIEKVARLKVVMEGSPQVGMDASTLGQVMLNIITNASQAIGEGKAASNLITVNMQEGPKEAVFTVSDTGPGIASENIDRVFNPYFTTKGGNTGIGLSVVQELVRQAGGQVKVESVFGKGATFTVTLPLVSYTGS